MNGRGGCCIARYAGGVYDLSMVDRIMLKFRPIAPKPAAAGSGSGGSTAENSDGYVKCRRGKRKYVRVNGNKNRKDGVKRCSGKERKVSPASSAPPSVTLSLLPETPDGKESSQVTGSPSESSDLLPTKVRKCEYNYCNKKSAPAPVWLNFNTQQKTAMTPPPPPPTPPPRRPQVVSYVTVECLTDTWVNGEELGCTDEERVMIMESDTCPGFISDGQDRVVWMNTAYKQMAVGGHLTGVEETAVVLVRKDKWSPAPVQYPAFTCKVKVTSGIHGHRRTSSPSSSTLTLPCDVWRMKAGGYAWRLDVKAALCLGR